MKKEYVFTKAIMGIVRPDTHEHRDIMGKKLIEKCFKKGYIPAGLEFTYDVNLQLTYARVLASYAGKRRAREIGYQELHAIGDKITIKK